MRKRIVYGIAIVIAFFIGLACSSPANANESTNAGDLKIWKQSSNGDFTTLNVVDDCTKVQYVVVVSEDMSHSGQPTIAMCPRYNADGTLYTGE